MNEEEFKIIDDDHGADGRMFKSARVDPITQITQEREAFFVSMRKKIKKNGNSTENIFKHKLVRDLMALGEISLIDAIDLEFFLNLPRLERNIWLLHSDNHLIDAILFMQDINNNIQVRMSEVMTNFILGRSVIQQSKTLCLSEAEYRALSKENLSKKVFNNRATNFHKAQLIFEALTKTNASFFTVNTNETYEFNIAETLHLRKDCARDIVTTAKRISNYRIATNNDDDMIYFKVINYLRTSLNPEVLHNAKNFDENLKEMQISTFKEIISQQPYSNLRVIQEEGNFRDADSVGAECKSSQQK